MLRPFWWLTIAFFFLPLTSLFAEGTKEIRPDSTGYGFVQLYEGWNDFGLYDAAEEFRLHITICNLGEKIYFGFNERDDLLEYRIKDPNGNIVYGPFAVPDTTEEGFINSYAEASVGPREISGAGGYDAIEYVPLMTGDYYIEFKNVPGRQFFDYFDVTVANAGGNAIPGRMWSKAWQFTTEFWTNSFQGKLYVYSDDQVVTSIDFNGMQPYYFVISCNSTGPKNTGDPFADRQSTGSDQDIYSQFKIFLNPPDPNCFPTETTFGQLTGPSTVTGCSEDSLCINVEVDKKGTVQVFLELNGTPGYQHQTADIMKQVDVVPGSNCILWDGKDGLGNQVENGTNIDMDIVYMNGLTHLPLGDVENHKDGLIVEAVTPTAPNPDLYWDDTKIAGTEKLSGCSTPPGCHSWNGFFGDQRTINTWWAANRLTDNIFYTVAYVSADANAANTFGSPNDTTICTTDTEIQLNGGVSVATGGQWSNVNGNFDPDDQTLNAKYTFTAGELASGYVEMVLTTTGNAGCNSDSDTLKITIANPPTADAGANQDVCANEASIQLNGSVQNVSGGTWSGGNGTFNPDKTTLTATYAPTATEISNGSLTLTLTSDAAGSCAAVSDDMIITFIDVPSTSIAKTDITCNGNGNGTATATATGGNPGYTYEWNTTPVRSTPGIQDLAVGDYQLIVTDIKGCTDTTTVTINEPAPLSAATTTLDHLSCNGADDGSIEITPSGGNGGFIHSWSSGQTSSTITGLEPGTYTDTITDSKGCSTTIGATINEPGAITATMSLISVSCNGGSNGGASVSPSGGVPGYQYSWSSSSATTSSLTGLSAGNHSVTVSDANACSTVVNFTITEPDPIDIVTSSLSNVTCNGGSNGSITISVSGGTPNYAYSWDNSSSTLPSVTSLSAGNHIVTVEDNNNCTTSKSVTISEPDAIAINFNITDANCGNSDGGATANVSGGNGAFTYEWGNPVFSTANAISNVVAGNYQFTATDSKGCKKTSFALINNKEVIFLDKTIKFVSCPGGNDGEASATTSGGTPPYTFSWVPAGLSTTDQATKLEKGTYYLTATDNVGCLATVEMDVTEPEPLIGSVTTDHVNCNGSSSGSIHIHATGGLAPYTFSWSPAVSNDSVAENLQAGIYTVIISDQKSCDTTLTIEITEPEELKVTVKTIQHVKCSNGNDGQITVEASGGVAPYTWLWNGGTNNPSVSGLTAGNHTVTVTDGNGCQDQLTVTITEPDPIAINFNSNNITCFGSKDGMAEAQVQGGVVPYSYLWNGLFSTTQTIDNLEKGSYTVIVTDSNGCTGQQSITIEEPDVLTASIGNVTHVQCNGDNDGEATVIVNGGTTPYSYSWTNSNTTATATGLKAGNYSVTVSDVNNCAAKANVNIQEPSAIVASIVSVTDLKCNGQCDGRAEVKATGGAKGYTYLWSTSPPQTAALATGLCAGQYTIIIQDKNKCGINQTITVKQPSPLSIDISDTPISCFGADDGTATATVSGGTKPYSYIWNPTSKTSDKVTNLGPGSLTVFVTDSNSCKASENVTITEPENIVLTTDSINHISCNGETDGSIDISATGGNPPYNYAWNTSPVQTTPSLNNLAPGKYTITVTDTNSCLGSMEIEIIEPGILTDSSITIENVSCNGGSDGLGLIVMKGGTKPYSFNWNSGQTSAIATGIEAGKYNVSVEDANGCRDTVELEIKEPESISLDTLELKHESCKGNGDGSISIQATGGYAPYVYKWAASQETGTMISGLQKGVYSLTVFDSAGCRQDFDLEIKEPATIVTLAADPPGICEGEGTIISVVAAEGAPPYTYTWNNGLGSGTSHGVSPDSTTTYAISVTDSCGETVTDSVTVQVYTNPEVSFGVDTLQGCKPFTAEFVNETSAENGTIYTWDFGDSTKSTITEPGHNYDESGTYTVKLVAESPHGCMDSLEKQMTFILHDPPQAGFDFEPKETTVFLSKIAFKDQSENAFRWEWDFGNGKSAINNPTHDFVTAGTHTITQVVYNSFGCSDTMTRTLKLTNEFEFWVPSSFSPNLDNKNETFQPQGIGVEDYAIYIYNRWGLMIFHSTSLDNRWNGTMPDGAPAQEDAYIYDIRVIDYEGKDYRYLGSVTLVR